MDACLLLHRMISVKHDYRLLWPVWFDFATNKTEWSLRHSNESAHRHLTHSNWVDISNPPMMHRPLWHYFIPKCRWLNSNTWIRWKNFQIAFLICRLSELTTEPVISKRDSLHFFEAYESFMRQYYLRVAESTDLKKIPFLLLYGSYITFSTWMYSTIELMFFVRYMIRKPQFSC